MKKIFMAKVLNVVALIEIILCISALIATPFLMNVYLVNLDLPSNIKNGPFIFTGCLYFCAIPFLMGLFYIKSLAKLFSSEGYSCKKVANKFTLISLSSIAEIIFVVVVQFFLWNKYKIFFYEWSIVLTLIVALICITFSIFSGVISSAFRNMEAGDSGDEDSMM